MMNIFNLLGLLLFSVFIACIVADGDLQISDNSILQALDSKACNAATAGTWLVIGDFTCFCRKHCFFLLCKYILENCRPITTTTSSTTTTIRTTTALTTTTIPATTTPQPAQCSEGPIPNFMDATEFPFYKTLEEQEPMWEKVNYGPVSQTASNSPSALILKQNVEGVDLTGTFHMIKDDDIVGIVFSFESPILFYLVSWKKVTEFDERFGNSNLGITIQLINSTDGLGGKSDELRKALWTRKYVDGQARTIYKEDIAWDFNVNYHWRLSHRPNSGTIRLVISTASAPEHLIDSGCLFETSLKGGRFGVYAAFQPVTFNTFSFTCNNTALLC